MAPVSLEEQARRRSNVQSILVHVRETAVTKEEAVRSIKEELGINDCLLSLLLQLCQDEISVDDVKKRLLAAESLTSLARDEAPVDEGAINSLLSERLRNAQVTKRTFQIRQAMGIRDPVQQTVEEVERGNISVLTAVNRLMD